MTLIQEIKKRLLKYPEVKWDEKNRYLKIHPLPGGFSVWVEDRDSSFTVGFDGWHEEFKDEEEAFEYLAFGLSDSCRLKVIKRGKFAISWTVQSKEINQWIDDSETSLIFNPFWKSKTIVYLQNKLISS